MRRFFKIHLRNILISALFFGVGTGIGTALASLLFNSGFLEPIRDSVAGGRLVLGLILIGVVVSLAGAIGGAGGGIALCYVRQSSQRWSYAWRTALAFGVSYTLILIPLTLYIASMAVYNISEISPIRIMIPLAVMGALFGLVCGLILGLLTVGRDFWRVLLAGIVGFALAGFMFGYGLWGYYFGTETVNGDAWILFTSFFTFGAIGGGALGYIYSWLTHRIRQPRLIARFIEKFKHLKIYGQIAAVIGLILLFLAVRGLWLISPFSANAAPLASKLELRTIGTHWRTPTSIIDRASQPAVDANEIGVALAWVRDGDIFYVQDDLGGTPIKVSNNASVATNPHLAIDRAGNVHLVWSANADILYSQCTGPTCTPPTELSGPVDLDCVTEPAENLEPALAIDKGDTLLVTWRNGSDTLLFSTWPAGTSPPATPMGCVPLAGTAAGRTVQQPRLSGGAGGLFALVVAQNSEIIYTRYQGGRWAAAPKSVGQGHSPVVFVDRHNQAHLAWCNPDENISYRAGEDPSEQIDFAACGGRPALAVGGNGLPRLVWHADTVENVGGGVNISPVLYESVRQTAGWAQPRIISQTDGPAQAAMVADEGTLHLVWLDSLNEAQYLHYAMHTEYDCRGEELSDIGQVIYDTVRQEKYRPPSDLIPYCQNQFDRLTYAPNPRPAFSKDPPTANGVFDLYAELARSAHYEVVYATMWYEADQNNNSPGFVVAEAVADLYRQLKADPSRYPRGLTVRIFLGNPPSYALFPTFNNQVRLVLEDLRAAGVPEMKNPELGWNLEVGNFAGAWPHSHTKLMVVDGKTAIGAGYNLQYAHYPQEHPSGLGKDKVDLGLQLTGPVAQATLRAFDDVWEGSVRVYCANFDPDSSFWWMFSCRTQSATADHVPEVLQYYLPPAGSHAFSLNRTDAFREADEAYFKALASAQSSIDIIQVNFSLQLICDLGVLLEVCNFNDRIDPQDGIMQAVEENRAQVRILVKETPIDGVENKIAIDALQKELEARGLSERVEVRFFNGDQMHAKAALIDQEWLVVGSHNFHYSAWGDQALTEYNLLTDDPEATGEFQKFFNYLWHEAIPVESKE